MIDRLALTALLIASFSAWLPPHEASAQYNYRLTWKAWSNHERDLYLWGFQEGSLKAYLIAAESWLPADEQFRQPETERVRTVRERTAFFFERGAIRDVMTDLYNDPANQFLEFHVVVHIARDKLRGEDVATTLLRARRKALDDALIRNGLRNEP